MRLALTDDQVAFRDAVRDLLEKEPAGARATWDALVEMGVTSVLGPERAGGLGLDEVTMVAILEVTGWAALAFPVVETAMVGRSGDRTVTMPDRDLVAWPATADGILFVEDRTVWEPVEAVDTTRPLGRLPAPVTVPADALAGAALGTAAQLVGLAQRMLDLTVGYVRERHQFGVPIGSFQAVKHHLADALKELAFARPAVYRAAWSMAHGAPTAARDVSMAKAMASDAAEFVARRALQCHGAIGYTVEYELHTYLKRTWALSRAYGDAAFHRDLVGHSLGV